MSTHQHNNDMVKNLTGLAVFINEQFKIQSNLIQFSTKETGL